MKNINELSETFKELYSIHEIFRCLGFGASDIYVLFIEHQVGMMLQIGDKEFVIDVGDLEDSEEEFMKSWQGFCQDIDQYTDNDLEHIFLNSLAYSKRFDIALLLIEKGFELPMEEDIEEEEEIIWN